MTDTPFEPKLWTPRSVAETQEVYAQWAGTYEVDVTAMNYATPARVAAAVGPHVDESAPILDFGCGTGLSGLAMAKAGYSTIDGTDISEPMLHFAHGKAHDGRPVYRQLWLGTPGEVKASPGTYGCIIATGVVSLGAAPPEMLRVLLDALAPGGILAFSYNDPTLADDSYISALDSVLAGGTARQLFREHGPHLSEKVTGSDVIVLART